MIKFDNFCVICRKISKFIDCIQKVDRRKKGNSTFAGAGAPRPFLKTVYAVLYAYCCILRPGCPPGGGRSGPREGKVPDIGP